MPDDPVPLRPAAGCAAAVHRASGQFASCMGQPVYAAVWREPHTRRRWQLFLCSVHRGAVEGAHPITDAEQVELQRRREAEQRALRGGGWAPPKPLPN
jgi:hypothetical protein